VGFGLNIEEFMTTLVSVGVLKRAKQILAENRVMNLKTTKTGLVADVRRSRGESFYSCFVNMTGDFACGCIGQKSHPDRICSHLAATLIKADETEYIKKIMRRLFHDDVEPIFTPKDFFETSLKGLNALLKGGIPVGTLFSFYGRYKAGKSIITQQLAWEVMKKYKMNAALFDTESDYFKPDAMPIWAARLNKRFNMNVQIVRVRCKPKWKTKDKKQTIGDLVFEFYPKDYDPKRQTAFVFDEGKFEILIALHGKPVAPQMKGGKIDLMPMDTGLYVFYVHQSKLGKFIKQHKIKFISYDSITRPFSAFHGGRVNYPVRTEAEDLWFIQIDELAKTYELISVCTHKQSKNPTDKYARPSPKGGSAIGHWFKRMIHMEKVGKTVARRLKVWRVPTEAEWDESSWASDRKIYLSNVGFNDLEAK